MTSAQRVVLILLVVSLIAGLATGSSFYYRLVYLWVFLFIGSCLFAYYHAGAAELPFKLLNESSADQVFPYFIVNQLPTGITGLLIASIFAAGMSRFYRR